MASILVPVDGSEPADRAVRYVVGLAGELRERPEIELLNVQYPVRGDVSMFVGSRQVEDYHREEGMKALEKARALLDAAGLVYHVHIGVGEPAEVISQFENKTGCRQICMGTRGLGKVGGLLLGSVAQKVIQLSGVPVVLVK